MQISSNYISEFEPHIKLLRSEAGKKIISFEESDASNKLFNYLSSHQSIRIVFSSLIKSGFFEFPEIDVVWEKLSEQFKENNISLVYQLKCRKCEHILEKFHVLDKKKIEIKYNYCSECKHRNKIIESDFIPDFELNLDDFLRILLYGCKMEVLTPVHLFVCLKCSKTVQIKSKLKDICPNCKNYRYLTSVFAPFYEELQDFVKSKQGYWLEWYIWKLLKKKYEIGINMKTKESFFECDILVLKESKKIIIECKDTNNDNHFINKLSYINKIADKYIFVTTQTPNKDLLNTMQEIFKEKLVVLKSKEIENIQNIIDKL